MNYAFLTAAVSLITMASGSLLLNASPPMQEIIQVIVQSSPELETQRQLAKAEKADMSDANRLSNPEVALSRVWGRHQIGNKLQLDVSQGFDWPGLYRMRGKAAQQANSAAQMLLKSNELDLALQAKQQLIELVYVRKQKDVQKQLCQHLAEMEKILSDLVAKGNATILDQRKQKFETYKANVDLSAIEARESQIVAALQCMCSPDVILDLDAINAYSVEEVASLEQYEEQLKDLDPVLASQRYSIEQESFNAKAATQSRLPGFTIGYQHQAEMGDRFNGFTLAMTLPFFENKNAKTAALSRKLGAEASLSQTLASRKAEIESQYAEMTIWRMRVNEYNAALGVDTYPKLLEKSYANGLLTAHEYISELQYFTEASATVLEAEYNYQQALASLNRYALLNNN